MSMGSEEAGVAAAEESSSSSNKVKFLCSYGGKILPRPSDRHLKYVGGETRVVAVPRYVSFSDLMKKISTLVEGEVVLKYQIIPEDLDALVTVRSDEDLKHMMDDHRRRESEGIPMLRTFLFPPKPVILENVVAPIDTPMIEQRYIDAINGVIHTPIIAKRPSFSISSACSSPKSISPEASCNDGVLPDVNVYQTRRLSMHKVQSSPNICSLNTSFQQSSNPHHFPRQQQQQQQHPYHLGHPQHQPHAYMSLRPPHPQDFHKGVGADRLPLSLSLGWGQPNHQFYPVGVHNSGSGSGGRRSGSYEECLGYGCGKVGRASSVPEKSKGAWASAITTTSPQ